MTVLDKWKILTIIHSSSYKLLFVCVCVCVRRLTSIKTGVEYRSSYFKVSSLQQGTGSISNGKTRDLCVMGDLPLKSRRKWVGSCPWETRICRARPPSSLSSRVAWIADAAFSSWVLSWPWWLHHHMVKNKHTKQWICEEELEIFYDRKGLSFCTKLFSF